MKPLVGAHERYPLAEELDVEETEETFDVLDVAKELCEQIQLHWWMLVPSWLACPPACSRQFPDYRTVCWSWNNLWRHWILSEWCLGFFSQRTTAVLCDLCVLVNPSLIQYHWDGGWGSLKNWNEGLSCRVHYSQRLTSGLLLGFFQLNNFYRQAIFCAANGSQGLGDRLVDKIKVGKPGTMYDEKRGLMKCSLHMRLILSL